LVGDGELGKDALCESDRGGFGLREHYESREVLIMIATKDERRTRKASTWKGKNTGSEQGVVAENKQQTHFQLKPELETNPHLIT
jgi:hypothetical protein